MESFLKGKEIKFQQFRFDLIKLFGFCFSNVSSPKHDKLVWTLNFYVIEMTSKFLSECDLLGDSVISANNILKRTNDLELFYLILNVRIYFSF